MRKRILAASLFFVSLNFNISDATNPSSVAQLVQSAAIQNLMNGSSSSETSAGSSVYNLNNSSSSEREASGESGSPSSQGINSEQSSSLNGQLPEQLEQEVSGGKPLNEVKSEIKENVRLLSSEVPSTTAEFSSIESGFYARTKFMHIKLRQFGYDFFTGNPHLALSVPVDSSYVLGPGDELFLYVIGAPPGIDLTKVTHLIVDRQGKIYIPGLGVFYVWGMTLGEAERMISRALGANIKLTVGRLRTFPVYVSGEVRRPGAVVVTGVNTVIDAIMMAGGIKKSGSLRNVVITRKTPKGIKRIHIDFYKLLLYGKPVDMRLRDGDVIFVNPIGKVAGIAGKVKRPAIYEITGKETLKDLINMAGGLLPSSYKYKVVLQRYVSNQLLEIKQGTLDDKKFMSQKVHDGDLLIIKQIISVPQNSVAVEGYTPYPGLYEYKPGMKLSQLLTPDFFFSDSNMKFGLIERHYPPGSFPKYITFSPEAVLSGEEDVELKPQDRIILYKFGNVEGVDFNKVKDAFVVEGTIKYPGVYAYKKGLKLSDILIPSLITENTNLSYAEIDRRDPDTLEITRIIQFSPEAILKHKQDIEIHRLDTIRFFPRYAYKPIRVSGEIRTSYEVPYHPGITLSEALTHAQFKESIRKLKVLVFREVGKEKQIPGGVYKKSKKEQNVASFFLYDVLVKREGLGFKLKPGDRIIVVRVSPEEAVEKVRVSGYVRHPGVYSIDEKTTLYDVLKEAGGFLPNAYPQGIIVLRKSVAEMQKKRLQKVVSLMKQQLEKEEAGMLQSDLSPEELRARQAAFEAKKKLLEELQKSQVTGRVSGIVVPKNLEKLKNSPYNIVLEDGDQIFIPKVPGSVLVFGEVYNPSALVYIKGLTVRDYIKKAGGFTDSADKKDIFVIKANGDTLSAESKFIKWDSEKKRFVWGTTSDILDYKLEPGDAIIVPTKIHVPVMWRPLIKDVVQIMYQSALTVYTVKRL